MDAHLFWFDDEQWAKIEPHLPKVQPGPQHKDDRRILSGIMHVLKVGCRWIDCPKEYGPSKTIYNRFAAGASAEFGRGYARRSRRRPSRPNRLRWIAPISKPIVVPAAEKGSESQAIGLTKGGRNSKIHAIVDTNPVRAN
jgi:transposase